ncbi:PHB depolymerase family esterase [Saccharopolyspora sp. NPDC047091]|uniref:extracellular catalytic domain type 1 short-chain-length polyhydroxyalkanoate depolymerase n=1 Tax=Saccharopolyspora sp. NPDC047091 TaxID=3155924 RepID=UPI0033CE3D4A
MSRFRRFALFGGIALAVVVLLSLGFQFGLPGSAGPRDRLGTYSSDQGRLMYQVHLPPDYREDSRPPVVMAVHGCAMTGFGWNSMKATTRFDQLADEAGFIVVYPTQSPFQNKLNCWNSTDPADQHRGRGEPELLAGIAREVVSEYHADPRQVHVTGASSGAGAAVILAATYPDVFATATSVAGGEYGLDQVDPEHPAEVPPTYTAGQAYAQMGPRARPVPLLVFQGDQDDVVPPLVADRLVEHWARVIELATGGDVDAKPESVVRQNPPGLHPYTRSTYAAAGGGLPVIESYLTSGMGHAWSGPAASGLFTDRAGPDMARLIWDFAAARPMNGGTR